MNQDLITHYGRVRVANVRMGTIEPDSAFTQRTTYINNLPKEVKMCLRSGLVMVFPVANGRRREMNQATGEFEFIIRHEYTFLRDSFGSTSDFLSKVTPEHSLELQQIRDLFFLHYQNLTGSQRDIRCVFEHHFSENDIRSAGNVFYHHDLDCVFGYGADCNLPFHPASYLGRKDEVEESAIKIMDKFGFAFTIELVDSMEQYGERYVSICKQVYRLIPKKDGRPDGIYVVSNKPTHGKITSHEIITEVYAFGDAEEQLGLYKNYELAKTYGDPNLHRKEELEKLQFEMKRHQLDAQREKAEADRANAALEAKERELQTNRDSDSRRVKDLEDNLKRLMDWERHRFDEAYHRRNVDRKEMGDMVKFLPVILTALGAVLMAVKTFKPEAAKT